MVNDARLEIRLPRELRDRLPKGSGERSEFVRDALVRALEATPGGSAPKGAQGEDGRVSPGRLKSDDSYPVSPRASEKPTGWLECTHPRCDWHAGPGFKGEKCPRCRSSLRRVPEPEK